MSKSDVAQTPEAVALELYRSIIDRECLANSSLKVDREYALSAYSECLRATKGTYKTKAEREKVDTRPLVRSLAGQV